MLAKEQLDEIMSESLKMKDKEIALLKATLNVLQRYHRGEGQYDYSHMADVGQQMGEDWEFVDELITKALE